MATINDLVLVHLDRHPAFYARINDITPDVKRGWYQVELLVLSLPPRPWSGSWRRRTSRGRSTPWGGGRYS